MRVLLINVLLTLVLSLIVVWLGLWAVCHNPSFAFCKAGADNYIYAIPITWGVVLGSFFLAQYNKTFAHFKKRTKSEVLPVFGHWFESVTEAVDTLWHFDPDNTIVYSKELDTREIPTHTGWVVEYSSGYKSFVDADKFHNWLIRKAIEQEEWEKDGRILVSSPISQRQSGLTKRKWEIYRQLLIDAKAVTQINGNIVVLKPAVRENPSRVITKLNSIRKVVNL